MPSLSNIILYVSDIANSTRFYQDILAKSADQTTEEFALFMLDGGQVFGIWHRDAVVPAGPKAGGGAEYCLDVANDDDLNVLHDKWRTAGVPIAQPPSQMPFGLTFVGTDPDGHRIRVISPAAA